MNIFQNRRKFEPRIWPFFFGSFASTEAFRNFNDGFSNFTTPCSVLELTKMKLEFSPSDPVNSVWHNCVFQERRRRISEEFKWLPLFRETWFPLIFFIHRVQKKSRIIFDKIYVYHVCYNLLCTCIVHWAVQEVLLLYFVLNKSSRIRYDIILFGVNVHYVRLRVIRSATARNTFRIRIAYLRRRERTGHVSRTERWPAFEHTLAFRKWLVGERGLQRDDDRRWPSQFPIHRVGRPEAFRKLCVLRGERGRCKFVHRSAERYRYTRYINSTTIYVPWLTHVYCRRWLLRPLHVHVFYTVCRCV
jgi:hypothetical protein